MDVPNRYQPPPKANPIPWAAIGCWIIALTILAGIGFYLHAVYQIWLTLDRSIPQ